MWAAHLPKLIDFSLPPKQQIVLNSDSQPEDLNVLKFECRAGLELVKKCVFCIVLFLAVLLLCSYIAQKQLARTIHDSEI